MKENKFLSMLSGAIIGFLLGTAFYIWPARCLFCGPIISDDLFMPQGLQELTFMLSMKYGGSIGVVIGILGGLSVPITMPRGHMSKAISCTCFLFCTPVVFIQHGHFLAQMSAGRIAMTMAWVFMLFCLSIPLGSGVSFIERIRE